MGLELTSICINVEEQFDIELNEDDWGRIVTVRDLYDCVIAKRGGNSLVACHSLSLFLQLRSALAQSLGIAPFLITLDTPLDNIVPLRGRRAIWKKTQRGCKGLDALELPRGGDNVVLAMAFVAAAATGAYLSHIFPWTGGSLRDVIPRFLGYSFSALIVWAVALEIGTRPFARRIPDACKTPRAFLQHRVPRLDSGDLKLTDTSPDDEVWRALLAIIAKELSIPPESIKSTDRFVEELRAG